MSFTPRDVEMLRRKNPKNLELFTDLQGFVSSVGNKVADISAAVESKSVNEKTLQFCINEVQKQLKTAFEIREENESVKMLFTIILSEKFFVRILSTSAWASEKDEDLKNIVDSYCKIKNRLINYYRFIDQFIPYTDSLGNLWSRMQEILSQEREKNTKSYDAFITQMLLERLAYNIASPGLGMRSKPSLFTTPPPSIQIAEATPQFTDDKTPAEAAPGARTQRFVRFIDSTQRHHEADDLPILQVPNRRLLMWCEHLPILQVAVQGDGSNTTPSYSAQCLPFLAWCFVVVAAVVGAYFISDYLGAETETACVVAAAAAVVTNVIGYCLFKKPGQDHESGEEYVDLDEPPYYEVLSR